MRRDLPVCACAAILLLCLAGPLAAQQKTETINAREAREAAQLRVLYGDLSRPIGPTEEAQAPLKDKLAKEIKIQFLDTPMERVVEFLQRESGITMLIDRSATQGREDLPVALEAEKMTIKDAIDWACLATESDWDVVKGVVVVSTSRAIERRQVSVKVYDIRGLVYQIPNFTNAPEFDLNSALSNTSSGGSSGGAISATTLFADDDYDTETITRAESVEQLVTLIQDTVGNQEDWQAYGGELSHLHEITGNLVVRTTPRNHAAIADLLSQMQSSMEKMVNIEAQYLLVKSKVLDAAIKQAGGDFIVDADKLDAFVKAVSDPATGNKKLGNARMVMFNGQRTYLTALNNMGFLSDVEPVSGAAGGLDPTVSVLASGAKLDIEATVTQGGKSIVMTFRGEVIVGKEARQTKIPAGGATEAASAELTGNVPAGGGNLNAQAQIKPGQKHAATSADLDLPEQDGVVYRTSAAIPNGGAAVLTGSSSMIKSLNMEDAEIVLIVRAKSK